MVRRTLPAIHRDNPARTFQNLRIQRTRATIRLGLFNQEDYRVVERALRDIDRPLMQLQSMRRSRKSR